MWSSPCGGIVGCLLLEVALALCPRETTTLPQSALTASHGVRVGIIVILLQTRPCTGHCHLLKSPPDWSPQISTALMGSILIALSVVAWKNSMLLVWDVACPNTTTPSYTIPATSESDAMASQATVKRCDKPSYLASSHVFMPVAMKTSGAIRTRTRALLTDFASHLR